MEHNTFDPSYMAVNPDSQVESPSVRLITAREYESIQQTISDGQENWTQTVTPNVSNPPAMALTPRYTPEQICRNRLKATIVLGAVLTSGLYGMEQMERTPRHEAIVAAPATEYTDITEPIVIESDDTVMTLQAPNTITIPESEPTPQPTVVAQASAETAAFDTSHEIRDTSQVENKRLAHQIASQEYGLSDTEITCMDKIVEGYGNVPGESQYRVDADNEHSSAYGIAQAMLSLHIDDIRANYPDYFEGTIQNPYGGNPGTQIRWMLDYMLGKRGTVCNNWEYKINHPTHAY